MRFAFLLPVSVALGTAGLIVAETLPTSAHPSPGDARSRGRAGDELFPGGREGELLTDIGAYRDAELAFDVAIPAGWTSIPALDDDPVDGASAEASRFAPTGRVVGFEAPRDGPDDPFADYLMIEILPGRESGRFATDGSRTGPVEIDGVSGTRDALVIEGHEVDGTVLDLVVHQAEIRGLGWTIGFYAIGETRRAGLVEDVFELVIGTFRLSEPPFRVS